MKKWPLAFLVVLALVGLRVYWTRTQSGEGGDHPPTTAPTEPAFNLADLDSRDPLLRARVARWLGQAPPGEEGRPPATATVAALTNLLRREQNESVHAAVVWALTQLGLEAAPGLFVRLEQEDRQARLSALAYFGLSGPGEAALLVQLADEHADTQRFVIGVASALAHMGKPVLPLLIAMLESGSGGWVRAGAALAVSIQGTAAREAIPALVALLKVENEDLAGPICYALSQMGRAAVPALRQALKNDNATVRAHAALALSVGVEAKPFDWMSGRLPAGELESDRRSAKKDAIPELRAALKDASPKVRLYAALALQDQGEEEQRATLPVLRELLQDPDPSVRQAAAWHLRGLEPLGRPR